MAQPKRVDGRTLRGERSREACGRAMLELIREGDLHPTAAAVAERAGVSLRLVFHHFKDMGTVLGHAIRLQTNHVVPLLPISVPPSAPFEQRVDALVAQRRAFFEEVSPVRRAARFGSVRNPAIREALDRLRKLLRDQTVFLFGAELKRLEDTVLQQERKARQAALCALTSWVSWESMRVDQGLDADEAERALRAGVSALLRP